MNYIGSKLTLMPFIDTTIKSLVGGKVDMLADVFAGTGSVGQNFKKQGAQIIANDLQYYSYVINKHLIGNSESLEFRDVDIRTNTEILFADKLSNIKAHFENIESHKGFIYNNYALGGTKSEENPRIYFSDQNAGKCDAIRLEIENWFNQNKITESEYYLLVASLLESIDKVANTTSVYGAFLKKLKKTALKSLVFNFMPTTLSDKKNLVFNEDANELIKNIEGQVLYLDPPYNHRQYAPNYHLLETIALYDNPKIKGVTGLRDYSHQKSAYCLKNEAQDSFAELIANARFDYIVLSYNNEGIIPIEFIEKIMRSKGIYSVAKMNYNRYKADANREYSNDSTIEYLHCVKTK